MEFRDYATSEASGLVSRLLARSVDQARHELQAFRKALDAAAQAAESALKSARPGQDEEIGAFVERLTVAAAAQIKSATDRAQKDAQAAIDAVRAELKAHVTEHEKLSTEKEILSVENDKLSTALNDARAQADSLRAELKTQGEQVEAARTELGRARNAEKKQLEARQKAEAGWQQETRAKTAVQRELEQAKGVLDAARAESTRLSKELEKAGAEHAKLTAAVSTAHSQAQAAETERQTVATALDEARAESARVSKQLEAASVEAQAALDRVRTIFGTFAGAATIADVLTALATGLATEFARVAVFHIRGNRLEAGEHIGFDAKNDISKVVMPVTIDSLLTRALAAGRIERLTASEIGDGSRAPFGGTPAGAIALPVSVDGQPIAVLYADVADQSRSGADPRSFERRTTFADVLRQHADLALVPLSRELKALAELREYATSLVNEVEYMYGADVKGGKKPADLQRCLKDNVECARRMYAQRIESEAPHAAALIEEQFAALLQARATTPFGRDLAAIVAPADRAHGQSASRQLPKAQSGSRRT